MNDQQQPSITDIIMSGGNAILQGADQNMEAMQSGISKGLTYGLNKTGLISDQTANRVTNQIQGDFDQQVANNQTSQAQHPYLFGAGQMAGGAIAGAPLIAGAMMAAPAASAGFAASTAPWAMANLAQGAIQNQPGSGNTVIHPGAALMSAAVAPAANAIPYMAQNAIKQGADYLGNELGEDIPISDIQKSLAPHVTDEGMINASAINHPAVMGMVKLATGAAAGAGTAYAAKKFGLPIGNKSVLGGALAGAGIVGANMLSPEFTLGGTAKVSNAIANGIYNAGAAIGQGIGKGVYLSANALGKVLNTAVSAPLSMLGKTENNPELDNYLIGKATPMLNSLGLNYLLDRQGNTNVISNLDTSSQHPDAQKQSPEDHGIPSTSELHVSPQEYAAGKQKQQLTQQPVSNQFSAYTPEANERMQTQLAKNYLKNPEQQNQNTSNFNAAILGLNNKGPINLPNPYSSYANQSQYAGYNDNNDLFKRKQ